MAVPLHAPGAQTPKYMPSGYHRLAKIMTREKTLANFRRFDDVLLMTLMRLQAEIMDLRGQFLFQAELDQQSGSEPEQSYSASFAKLRASKENEGEQLDLLDRMGTKLREYWSVECCPVFTGILLTQLTPQDHSLLRYHILPSTTYSSCKAGYLIPLEAIIFSLALNYDYGTTRAMQILAETCSHLWRHIFHHAFGERWKLGTLIDEESGLTSYDDSKINRATSIVTTVLSSILPLITILILYEIKNPYGRIGVTIGFTAIFAAVLSLFTKARRVEVLVATATFAAVEVVFIGSAIGHSAG